ncbi:MAG: Hsp20/alpha crystallin family protein [Syntrophomonadaceae bacterium]|nr:Hsp20/alpha crystallin family protein [Syntrophomonadaceae bacterium]
MKRDMAPYQRYNPPEMLRGSFPGNFLDNFFNNSFMAGFNTNMRSDIKENEHEYVVEIEMPGYAKENIDVACQDGHLTITAANSQENDEEKNNYIRQERQFGRISRSYRIDGINENKITAAYRNGILVLTLPKSDDSQDKRKRIDIH